MKKTIAKFGNNEFTAIDLSDQTYSDWQEYRSKSILIGGSEVGAILGINPYKDALSLWASKIGFVRDTFIPSEASAGGHIDEDGILKRLTHWDGMVWVPHFTNEQTFRKISKPPYTYLPEDAPFIALNIDGAITDDKDYPGMFGVAEAKKISSHVATKYIGRVPSYYIAQLCAYMYYLRADFGRIALLEDGVKLNVMTIDATYLEYQTFVGQFWRLKRFYEATEAGVIAMKSTKDPEDRRSLALTLIKEFSDVLYVTENSKYMLDGVKSSKEYTVVRTDDLDLYAESYLELSDNKKEVDAQLETVKNMIRLYMEQTMADSIVSNRYKITNSKQGQYKVLKVTKLS